MGTHVARNLEVSISTKLSLLLSLRTIVTVMSLSPIAMELPVEAQRSLMEKHVFRTVEDVW